MHELALADAVVKAALRAADDAGIRRLDAMVIRIGELQQIDTDLFRYSLTSVVPHAEPRLAGVDFTIEDEPVEFHCRMCDTTFARGALEETGSADALEAMHLMPELAHTFVRCPECASPDFEITAGRGVTLLRIEGIADDDAE